MGVCFPQIFISPQNIITFFATKLQLFLIAIFDSGSGGFMREKEYYRKEIIEMVQNINRCDILIYVYKLICDIIKEDNDGEAER